MLSGAWSVTLAMFILHGLIATAVAIGRQYKYAHSILVFIDVDMRV